MTLKKGDSSDLVTDWQMFLVSVGITKMKPTGYFGEMTEKATKDFQLKYGLVPDGIVGEKTRAVSLSLSSKDSLNEIVGTIDGVKIIASKDGKTISFISKAMIDADGGYKTYHPDGIGLDYLQNAKSSNGEFVGVLTDKNGKPIVQGKNDPAPGYYISTTSYQNDEFKSTDPRRYLDSETVVYMVLPKQFAKIKGTLGAKCEAVNTKNGKSVIGIIGDFGPKTKIGEMSMACAESLGLNPSPKRGGTDQKIIQYTVYLNESANGYKIKN